MFFLKSFLQIIAILLTADLWVAVLVVILMKFDLSQIGVWAVSILLLTVGGSLTARVGIKLNPYRPWSFR